MIMAKADPSTAMVSDPPAGPEHSGHAPLASACPEAGNPFGQFRYAW